jgi:hypothetical protein
MTENDFYIFRDQAVIRDIDSPTFYGREVYVRTGDHDLLADLHRRWGGYLSGRRWTSRSQRTVAEIEAALDSLGAA